ncbi:drug/metabolite transporter (DMT)-like permease [Enterobacter sp. BIGb0383]|uniref:DMT family transporter n=1 Tax=unclassified Enterobacter TaxID=2608935 RepID=UPI000F4A4C39|nr:MULTISPECIES: DMT family transporter [unclassified Enterobacter]ROP62215.1 drug/metabolite transporter (DMT)-like permease [Enterobacter sp. BIGb0383]ROS12376.1 drug/metabolite transporter (DMT)-like permease [Enterobacter sp. BIGb0359]
MNALLYTLVVAIWGTTWIGIYLQQGPVPAPVSIFWRFAVASAVMMLTLVALRRLRKMALRDHLFCVLQGCCVFAFNFWCFYTAAAWISSGLESVIFSMAVLFNAINSFLFFGQRPPARFYVAAGMGLLGIVTLFWHDLTASILSTTLLLGIGLSALGTYGFSLGNMISLRHQRNGLDVMTTNAWAMMWGTLVMGSIALIRGDAFTPEWTTSYLGALVYLAIFGSVIGFGAYFTLVGRIGPGKAAYSTLLFPLVALTLSTLYEGYSWSANAVAGLALILLGNLVMFSRPENWFKSRRLRRETA